MAGTMEHAIDTPHPASHPLFVGHRPDVRADSVRGDVAGIVTSPNQRGDIVSGVETWLVRGWQEPMKQYFDGAGGRLVDVVDLDLEEAFVELLSSSRVEEN